MFNKKYKKGMADAAKAYEAFGKKQEDALKHILEEVRQGNRDLESVLRELNGNMDSLYDYIDSKEKARLYSVYTPFDIIKLDKNDRLFLVGVLYRLTADKTPNENQQNYIRAVQKYLEIKEPPFGINPMYIETIEDIPTQKAILQTVLEYLYLQDGDSYDETEYQQEFLDAFSVNAKGRKEIMDHIDLLYTATGAKGLAEKYGYVPEEEEDKAQDTSVKKASQTDFVDLADDTKDKIVACKYGLLLQSTIETERFILAEPDGFARINYGEGYENTICVNKTTGEVMELTNYACVNRPRKLLKLETLPDSVVTWYEPDIREAHIGIFNLETKQYTEIDSGQCMELLCTKDHYIVYFQETTRGSAPNKLFVYDTLTSKIRIIGDPPQDAYYGNLADISEGVLYFVGWKNNSNILYKVALESDLTPEIICSIGDLGTRNLAMKIVKNTLFLIDKTHDDTALVYRGDLAELDRSNDSFKNEDSSDATNTSALFDFSSTLHRISKNRPPYLQKTCILGKNEHLSSDMAFYNDILLYGDKERGFLEAFKWDTEENVRLVQSGVYCESFGYGTPFIRLGNWIYFRKNVGETWSRETYKVNLDAPQQIEKVRT